MGKISRYYTTLKRYHASKGYGIHSPFAFNFVLKVLRERLPYYAYADIESTRKQLLKALKKSKMKHPRIISSKNAKMLFRITNYFNPMRILQIGSNYGVSTSTMLRVSSKSFLVLYEKHIGVYPVKMKALMPFPDRIVHTTSFSDAIAEYGEVDKPFVLVNNLDDDDFDQVADYVKVLIDREGVVVMRNLSRKATMLNLWKQCNAETRFGMSFSNGKIGVFVANRKLPRQDYSLWL